MIVGLLLMQVAPAFAMESDNDGSSSEEWSPPNHDDEVGFTMHQIMEVAEWVYLVPQSLDSPLSKMYEVPEGEIYNFLSCQGRQVREQWLEDNGVEYLYFLPRQCLDARWKKDLSVNIWDLDEDDLEILPKQKTGNYDLQMIQKDGGQEYQEAVAWVQKREKAWAERHDAWTIIDRCWQKYRMKQMLEGKDPADLLQEDDS